MDGGMAGPVIVPLPQTYEFDNAEITDYITQVLQQFSIQDAYGILAAVENSRGEINPTIILGIPGLSLVRPDLPQPPNNLRLLVQDDCMLAVNDYKTTWSADPIKNLQQLDLQPCSVGLESSPSEAVFPSVQSVRISPRTGRMPSLRPLPRTDAQLQSILTYAGTDSRAL
ncbi:hypothetical protein HOY82DRAFT_626411, partial [Tuber indicum]